MDNQQNDGPNSVNTCHISQCTRIAIYTLYNIAIVREHNYVAIIYHIPHHPLCIEHCDYNNNHTIPNVNYTPLFHIIFHTLV